MTGSFSLAGAIIGHLVGDFLVQSDAMARDKQLPGWKGRRACLLHAAIWASTVWVFSGFTIERWGCVLFLLACHYLQDRLALAKAWMRAFSPGFMDTPFAPWSVIVVDNTWHLVQIWLVWDFITP